MRTKIVLLFLLGWVGMVFGQKESLKIGFVKDTIKVTKSSKDSILIPIEIKNKVDMKSLKGKDYKIQFEIDNNSSLPPNDYKIDFKEIELTKLRESEYMYVTIKSDPLHDRVRFLKIKLIVKNLKEENFAEIVELKKEICVLVKAYEDTDSKLDEYELLSYVGTNFDMADGKTKAKNLFFATNVFIPPARYKNKIGFYLSLYGNRTMSNTDSLEYRNRIIKVQPVNDSLYFSQRGSGTLKITTVSDNMGAYISPLIKLSKRKNKELNLFYAPSLEFVWRRINIENSFESPNSIDTIYNTGNIKEAVISNQNFRSQVNEFNFNLGFIGAFLVYETKDLSVRVHSSIGYVGKFYNNRTNNNSTILGSEVYTIPMQKSHDIFYTGRAWITESKTGITLQAEITNQLKNPRPYFGVTLSKAFKLKSISEIFNPIIK